jgi:hypothetical protein
LASAEASSCVCRDRRRSDFFGGGQGSRAVAHAAALDYSPYASAGVGSAPGLGRGGMAARDWHDFLHGRFSWPPSLRGEQASRDGARRTRGGCGGALATTTSRYPHPWPPEPSSAGRRGGATARGRRPRTDGGRAPSEIRSPANLCAASAALRHNAQVLHTAGVSSPRPARLPSEAATDAGRAGAARAGGGLRGMAARSSRSRAPRRFTYIGAQRTGGLSRCGPASGSSGYE